MRFMKSFLVVAVAAFATHFVWEYLHLPLYNGYQALGSGTSLVLYATLGDVAYTFGAILLVSLFKHKLNWIPQATRSDFVGLAILGLLIAFFVEYKALVLHRWAYTAAMPVIFGAGVSPLLQMTLLLPLCVYLARWVTKK